MLSGAARLLFKRSSEMVAAEYVVPQIENG
jgi:hypothetical protein